MKRHASDTSRDLLELVKSIEILGSRVTFIPNLSFESDRVAQILAERLGAILCDWVSSIQRHRPPDQVSPIDCAEELRPKPSI